MGGRISLQTATLGAVRLSALPAVYAVVKEQKDEVKGDVIIIPVDQSQHAEAAFEWYLKHVHRPGNFVHIVHCIEVAHVSPYQLGHGMKTRSIREFYEEEMEKASKVGENVRNKYEEKLAKNEVKGDVVTDTGYAGEVIVRNADRHKAAMIVMGSRGFGAVRRTILGSISHYVIHHTSVPVTIIPKEAQSWFF